VTHTLPPFHFTPLPYYLGGVAYSPPRRWGGILSHNDGGGSFHITTGQRVTHALPPRLTSFTPLVGGECIYFNKKYLMY